MTLGKIASVRLGEGGYQGAMFGFDFHLETKSGSLGDFWGFWTSYPSGADYTEEVWKQKHADAYMRLGALMKDADVDDFADLEGKPIEITMDGERMVSWRILKEVL